MICNSTNEVRVTCELGFERGWIWVDVHIFTWACSNRWRMAGKCSGEIMDDISGYLNNLRDNCVSRDRCNRYSRVVLWCGDCRILKILLPPSGGLGR
jgi:hypothetical protein